MFEDDFRWYTDKSVKPTYNVLGQKLYRSLGYNNKKIYAHEG